MAYEDTPTVPAPDDHAPLACLNCGELLTGAFCARCGQSGHTHRFTWAHLLHEIPHSLWHVDAGLPYTLREMFVRPGITLHAYLAGRRVRLFRPLALVLLLAGIAALLLATLHLDRLALTHAPTTPAEQQADAVNKAVFKYLTWFTVAMLPLYAGLSWALLRRLRYNFVEHFMANSLVMGGALALQIVLLPPLAWAAGTPWLVPLYWFETLVLPLYQAWAFTRFGLGPYRLAGSLWRSLVVVVVGLLLNSVLIMLLGRLILHLVH